MKKTSISFTCLLLITATGFSQKNNKGITEPQHRPVSGLAAIENRNIYFLSSDYSENLFFEKQEYSAPYFKTDCFPKEIFENKK